MSEKRKKSVGHGRKKADLESKVPFWTFSEKNKFFLKAAYAIFQVKETDAHSLYSTESSSKNSREKEGFSFCSFKKSLWHILIQAKTFLRVLLIIGACVILFFNKESLFSCVEKKNELPIPSSSLRSSSSARMGAYIRFKDEIKTLPAMLASIDGVFDKIVMIHSNEPDDGSIAYANWWCAQRPICEIHMYPYAVVPSNDPRYRKKEVAPENTLAAYYMFGLQFFKPEEYVVKIDADQVYMTDKLKQALTSIRQEDYLQKKIYYGMRGYNTFVYRNQMVNAVPVLINGGSDHYIIKRKHIQGFIQKEFWELISLIPGLAYQEMPGYYWFHFMKSLKKQATIRTLEESQESERLPLTPEQELLFNQEIRPLLRRTASPYRSVSF